MVSHHSTYYKQTTYMIIKRDEVTGLWYCALKTGGRYFMGYFKSNSSRDAMICAFKTFWHA